MGSIEQIKTKVDDLTTRYTAVSKKKSQLQGQLQAKREELIALKKEIEAAGLNPNKLKEKRDELETEVTTLIKAFDHELSEVETALAAFDKK